MSRLGSIADLRSCFKTIEADKISISREEFEKHFRRTTQKVVFTFNGWDGKSYEGEARVANVYFCNIPGFENNRFVKVGKSIHQIDTYYIVREKATGILHPATSWVIDVRKKEVA